MKVSNPPVGVCGQRYIRVYVCSTRLAQTLAACQNDCKRNYSCCKERSTWQGGTLHFLKPLRSEIPAPSHTKLQENAQTHR